MHVRPRRSRWSFAGSQVDRSAVTSMNLLRRRLWAHPEAMLASAGVQPPAGRQTSNRSSCARFSGPVPEVEPVQDYLIFPRRVCTSPSRASRSVSLRLSTPSRDCISCCM
jgi:hypothetical protein